MRFIVYYFILFGFSLLTPYVTAIDFSVTTLDSKIEHVDDMLIGDFSANSDTTSNDIILVGRDEQRQKWLQLITLEQGKAIQAEPTLVQLDQQVMFHQTGTIANSKQRVLFFLMPDKVVRFDPATNKLLPVIDSLSIYRHSQARTSTMRKLEFLFDVNDDGLSDIIMPDFDHSYIFVQQPDGSFAPPQAIKVLAQSRVLRNTSAVYFRAKLYLNDYNFDGEQDLFYRTGVSLQVFVQQQGKFNPNPINIPLKFNQPLSDEYDDIRKDQSNLVTHLFHRMIDLNNDSILDVITQITNSAGFFDKSSSYQVYFGRKTEQAQGAVISYGPDFDAKVSSKGLQFELSVVDFNGDNHLDLVSPSFEIGVGSIIASLFSSSADLDISFHPLLDGKQYNTKPQVKKEITVNFNLSSGQQVYPLMLIDDFNGDGHKDLLTGHNGKKLYWRKGENNKRAFARRAKKFNMPLPKNGKFVQTSDFNNDGKADLIVRYDQLDDKALSSQLKLLLTL